MAALCPFCERAYPSAGQGPQWGHDTLACSMKAAADRSALLAALKALLPVAQQFERQASKGVGGRRGGAVFEQASAAIAKAEGRTP